MKLPTPSVLGLVATLFWLAPPQAAAQEREEILSFDVRVEIQDGGRMIVAEEITVRALGDEIERGIYRDFPTDFPRAGGWGRIQAPFNVLSVERDGRGEPWSVESIGGPAGRGGVRVRIGNANVLLDPGEHRYRIVYETWRWVRFGEGEDQLYWNVTGNGWGFPILDAAATLTLPEGGAALDADDIRMEAWTGPEGSGASDATFSWAAASRTASFRTTRPLDPREGLTVRLSFPKGVVEPPSAAVEEQWFRMDWGGYLDAATVVGLVLALYLFMWSRVGRDPAKGPLVVRYEPPEGFSPAALGYLEERGYRRNLLAATLVGLGVKGALVIRQKKRKRSWVLERGEGSSADLAPEEKVVREELLGTLATLDLTPSHAPRLQKAIKGLKRSLSLQMEKRYFHLNRAWFGAGLALSLAGFAALAWRDRYGISPEVGFFALWLSFWSLGTGTLVYRAGNAWRSALTGGGAGSWAEAVFLSLFSTPFVAAWFFVSWLLTTRVPRHLLVAAAALGFVNILFYHLLERPTLKGRGVLDKLAGFRAFLTATDADRLDRTLPPDRTPELFERYLPHAIALGVENRWAEGFEGVLAAGAATAGAGAGALAWYQGGSVSDVGSVASALGGSFSSSLSSASSPPSSGGGGGGGGGSSGGGGGGGGGGGW